MGVFLFLVPTFLLASRFSENLLPGCGLGHIWKPLASSTPSCLFLDLSSAKEIQRLDSSLASLSNNSYHLESAFTLPATALHAFIDFISSDEHPDSMSKRPRWLSSLSKVIQRGSMSQHRFNSAGPFCALSPLSASLPPETGLMARNSVQFMNSPRHGNISVNHLQRAHLLWKSLLVKNGSMRLN